MPVVNGSIQLGYKDSAWFAANPTLVLLVGQKVYLEQTGTYKLGDGVTQLSSLSFLGAYDLDTTLAVGNTSALSITTGSNTTNGDMGVNGNFQATSPDALTELKAIDGLAQLTLDNQGIATNSTSTDITHSLLVKLSAANVQLEQETASVPLSLDVSKNIKPLTASIWGAFINALTGKTTPVDADYVTLMDSTDSNKAKKLSWANIKATLWGTTTAMTAAINEAKGLDIASAATTNIGAATGNYVHITGTNTIIAFDTVQAGTERTLVFNGALTLTHNATSLILPGAANILTSAGDVATFVSEGGGNWRCVSYVTASDSYTNYSPTFTGFSVAPTVNAGDARWKMITRNTCHVIICPTSVGTSNTTTKTVTLPFNPLNNSATSLQSFNVPVFNNGVHVNGTLRTRNGSTNVVDVYNGVIGTAWTGAGNCSMFINIVYQIEI